MPDRLVMNKQKLKRLQLQLSALRLKPRPELELRRMLRRKPRLRRKPQRRQRPLLMPWRKPRLSKLPRMPLKLAPNRRLKLLPQPTLRHNKKQRQQLPLRRLLRNPNCEIFEGANVKCV